MGYIQFIKNKLFNKKEKKIITSKTHMAVLEQCEPLDPSGLKVEFIGWDSGNRSWMVGDFIIFKIRDGGETRYKVLDMHHYSNPPDMYKMTGEFSPRSNHGIS